MANLIIRPAVLKLTCTRNTAHDAELTVKIGDSGVLERRCQQDTFEFTNSFFDTEGARSPEAHVYRVSSDGTRHEVLPRSDAGTGFEATPRGWFNWKQKMLSGKQVTRSDIAAFSDAIASEFAKSGAASTPRATASSSQKSGEVVTIRPIWRQSTEILDSFKKWVLDTDLAVKKPDSEEIVVTDDLMKGLMSRVLTDFEAHIAEEKSRHEAARRPQAVIQQQEEELRELRAELARLKAAKEAEATE